MRILMLNHNVAFTGGATFFRALQFARHLAAQAEQVTLLCSQPAGVGHFAERNLDGLQLVTAPGILPRRWRYGYDYYEAWRRVRWLRQQPRYDIVYAFDSRPVVIYPALAAQRSGARLVMDWCDWFGRGGSVDERRNAVVRLVLGPLETYYEEAFRRQADATTVISSVLEARARAIGVDPTTILRLPGGADTEKLHPELLGQARALVGLPVDGLLVGYLGSLFPADAELLSEAWNIVLRSQPEARLVLIGDTKSPLAIERGVIRTGFVPYDRLGHYLSACNVLCLPLTNSIANRGRWPSKLMDYFAVGRPTVGCAVGEVGAIIREAQAGFVAEPNPEGLATGLLGLLADRVQAEQLGCSARRAAEDHYGWPSQTAQLDRLFRSLH
jgi:glycosyltransferase involved in cell wall biosynthesis